MKLVATARRRFEGRFKSLAIENDRVLLAGGGGPESGRRSERFRSLACFAADGDFAKAEWESIETRSRPYESLAVRGEIVAATVPLGFPGDPCGLYVSNADTGSPLFSLLDLGVADLCTVSGGRVVATYSRDGVNGLVTTTARERIDERAMGASSSRIWSLRSLGDDILVSRTIDVAGERSIHTRLSSDLATVRWEIDSLFRYACPVGDRIWLHSGPDGPSGRDIVDVVTGDNEQRSRSGSFNGLHAVNDRFLMAHTAPNRCDVLDHSGAIAFSLDLPARSDFVDFAGGSDGSIFLLACSNPLTSGSTLTRFGVVAGAT